MRRALAVIALVIASVPAVSGTAGADSATDVRVDAIAERLRCPVCQNLSVRDSPSKVAQAFRDRIRELVAAGRSDEEIEAFFVERYGEWILLSPPKQGVALTVWFAPVLLLGAGLTVVAITLHRWTARARRLEHAGRADPAALAEARARLAAIEQDVQAP